MEFIDQAIKEKQDQVDFQTASVQGAADRWKLEKDLLRKLELELRALKELKKSGAYV